MKRSIPFLLLALALSSCQVVPSQPSSSSISEPSSSSESEPSSESVPSTSISSESSEAISSSEQSSSSEQKSSSNQSSSSSESSLSSSSTQERYLSLSLYAFNDFHGAIVQSGARAGAGRFFTYLRQKMDMPNTLSVDSGDTWQGSLYSNLHYGAMLTNIMNYSHISARTVGNHDFDWGVEKLIENSQRVYDEYRVPVLAGNVYSYNFDTKTVLSDQRSDIGGKSVTYTLDNGLKVGIVGVIGKDQITSISSMYVKDIAFTDHISVLKEEATRLKQEEGCDILIGSVHAGQEDVQGYGLEDYYDVMLCGHTHRKESSRENGLLYGQYGCYGQNLGNITIQYDTQENRVASVNESVISGYAIQNEIDEEDIDPEIARIISRYSEQAEMQATVPVATDVSGYFSRYEQLPNLMCEAMYDCATKQGFEVSLAYCNEARVNISGYSWTYADIYEAFPFDNKVYIIDIDGHDFEKEILNYNYLYRSDSFAEAFDPNKTYRIAVIDFLAFHTNANRYYDYFDHNNGRYVAELEMDNYRVMLKDYLEEKGFTSGKTLRASDYSSSLPRFDRNQLNQPL